MMKDGKVLTEAESADVVAKAKEFASAAEMEPMLQFFAYAHLAAFLQPVSKPFGELAVRMVLTLPRNPERTVMLRKLLEAKDCAVRALLWRPVLQDGTRPPISVLGVDAAS